MAGYAVRGGNVLHMVYDLTIEADNTIFGQTGPKVVFFFFLVKEGSHSKAKKKI